MLAFKLSLPIRPTTCLNLGLASWGLMGWEDVVSALRVFPFIETKSVPSLYQEGNSFPHKPTANCPPGHSCPLKGKEGMGVLSFLLFKAEEDKGEGV